MLTLTTRQRDILRILLDAQQPIGSADMAGQLNLTPRQVNYSLRGLNIWLREHNHELTVAPGVGTSLSIPSDEARALLQTTKSPSHVQIVLSVSQRRQLLALFLLPRSEPFILSQLEQIAQVSRMTLTKDLDEIEGWLTALGNDLIRKPHFGVQVRGGEHNCQQALA